MTNEFKPENLREEYIARMNRVIDYINNHLDDEMTLAKLAEIACFSPFHFHRLFSAVVGETVSQYILRLRIEKAADQLMYQRQKSITAIALDCGFSGSAVFSRSFREQRAMSPSEWRSLHTKNRKECKTERKPGQPLRKAGKATFTISMYFDPGINQTLWRIQMRETNLEAKVKVQNLQDITVAYVRHVGPYKGDAALFDKLFTRLCSWAGARNLINMAETQFYSVYHDNPEVTDAAKLRLSVCLSVPADTEVSGEIGKMILKGGRYAIARFEIEPDQFQAAWDTVYGGWLPESGFQPDDGPTFEWFHSTPKEHPQGKFVVSICVPVKPL